jgi:hypothetical protein
MRVGKNSRTDSRNGNTFSKPFALNSTKKTTASIEITGAYMNNGPTAKTKFQFEPVLKNRRTSQVHSTTPDKIGERGKAKRNQLTSVNSLVEGVLLDFATPA